MLELPVEPSQAREAAMRHFRGRLKQVGGRMLACVIGDGDGHAWVVVGFGLKLNTRLQTKACYLLHGGSGPAMGMQKDDEVRSSVGRGGDG